MSNRRRAAAAGLAAEPAKARRSILPVGCRHCGWKGRRTGPVLQAERKACPKCGKQVRFLALLAALGKRRGRPGSG